MIFTESGLNGAFVIDLEPLSDERGMFARSWCQREFEAQGLKATWVQHNVSFSHRKGTLRGMHYQAFPHEEVKLVRCTMGAIYDVIVDLRPESLTYCRHIGVTLSAENRRGLYIPQGFAHGFLTLSDNCEVSYQMSEYYAQDSARGVRWDDPAFRIEWPESLTIISKKDRSWPKFSPDFQTLS